MNYLTMYIFQKISHYLKIVYTILSVILLQATNSSITAQDIVEPLSPPRLVNDYTSTLTPTEKRSLEEKLRNLEKETSIQLAVVIIPTLNGYDISDYAFRLGEKWGVGTKENNGIVFLTSLGEKKVFIATGYGIEGILPDAYSKRILTQSVTPYYKNGDIYKGINLGVSNIISIVKQNYKSLPDNSTKTVKMIGIPSLAIILFIIITVIVFKFTSSQFYHLTSPKNNHHTAGGEGKLMSWLLLSMLLNKGRSHRNIWDDFNSGNSGRFGDSDSFGGFSGGRFGGGGAGDSW